MQIQYQVFLHKLSPIDHAKESFTDIFTKVNKHT